MLKVSPQQFAALVSAHEVRERDRLIRALAPVFPAHSEHAIAALQASYPALKAEALALMAQQARQLYLHAFLSMTAGRDYLTHPAMAWFQNCLTENFTHPPHFGVLDRYFDIVVNGLSDAIVKQAAPFAATRIVRQAALAFVSDLPGPAVGIGPIQSCSTIAKPNDEAFRLLNPRTGRPVVGAKYEVEAEGRVYRGVTDKQGFTDRVFTGLRTSAIRIRLLDEPAEMRVTPIEDDGCL